MTTSTALPAQRAIRRIDAAVNGVRNGTTEPAAAVAIVEALAATIPVAAYDAALDAIADAAGPDANLDPQSSKRVQTAQRVARHRRNRKARRDSDTRRATRREQSRIKVNRSVGDGATGVAANKLRHITAAPAWRTRQIKAPVVIDYFEGPCPDGGDWGAWRPAATERREVQREAAAALEAELRASAYRHTAGDGPVTAPVIGWHDADQRRYQVGENIITEAELAAIGNDPAVVCPECHMVGMCDC